MRSLQAWLATALIATVNGYWLMAAENTITTERMDPLVSPGKVSGHTHSAMGGSNFRLSTNTSYLRQSECTSMPIAEDKSAYWFPHCYFQWKNGSFTSLNGGPVIYYLFGDKPGTTTAFPDDFRMLSGNPTLRTYDANSYEQQAITFLCLDFNGVTTRHNELPSKICPSGIRAQVNFPSCWDGKNLDSPDHKSHVAFLSGGPDSGTCSDPKYPVTLPRIFIEVYWNTGDVEKYRSEAMNPSQPFVFAYGDPTGYGYHADFINGWDKGVLQRAVDECHCDPNGSLECCANKGVFTYKKNSNCHITRSIDEQTTGTLPKLPGNNPVQPYGKPAIMYPDPDTPGLISPVYAYMGDTPPRSGSVVVPPSHGSTSAEAPSSSKPASSASAISTSKATSTVEATTAPGESDVSTSLATSTTAAPSTSTNVSSSASVIPSSSSAAVTSPTNSAHATSHVRPTTTVVITSYIGTSTQGSAPHTTSAPPSSGSGSNNPANNGGDEGEGEDDDCDDEEGPAPAGDDKDDDDCDDEDDEAQPAPSSPNHNHPPSPSPAAPKPQQNNHNSSPNSDHSYPAPNGGSSSLTHGAAGPQCGVRKFRHKWLKDLQAAKESEVKKQPGALKQPTKRSSFYRVHHDRVKRLITGY